MCPSTCRAVGSAGGAGPRGRWTRAVQPRYTQPGSLFTYDYSKDYSTESFTTKIVGSSFMEREANDSSDDSSSTVVGSCLMVREAKVIQSPPSLSSILDDNETDDQYEDSILEGLYKVRCTLRGDALVMFDLLMDSLNERDEPLRSWNLILKMRN